MVYPNGKVATTPKGMAHVFRQFYEELYASNDKSKNSDKAIFKSKQKTKPTRVTVKAVDKALKD